jgi:hypothetical protein
LNGRALGRRRDAAGGDGLAGRQHARAEHRYAQQVEVIRRIRGLLPSGGHASDVGDHRLRIRVAQSAGVGVGHERQPAPVRVDGVADCAKDLAIGPVLQSPGRGQVGGDERPDANREILADVEAAGERAGLGMALASQAAGQQCKKVDKYDNEIHRRKSIAACRCSVGG